MLELVPELNHRQCSRLRVERFGYRSFYVRYKTRTMPWIMNKTTVKILDMCDGVATAFQIIEQMKKCHNNVPDVKICDDTVKTLALLTTMGFLRWREPFSSRPICRNGFSLVSEMLVPRLDIFIRKIKLGCNVHPDWGYLEIDPEVAKVASIAVSVNESHPTENVVVATDEDGEICGAAFVSILSVSKTCVYSELCLTRLSTFDPCFHFFHIDKLLYKGLFLKSC